jgi:hypothetical protein
MQVHTAGRERDAHYTYCITAGSGNGKLCRSITAGGESDALCKYILLAVEGKTSCMSIHFLKDINFMRRIKQISRKVQKNQPHMASQMRTKAGHEPGSSRSLAYCSTIVPHFHAYCKYQKQNCILNTLKYFSP